MAAKQLVSIGDLARVSGVKVVTIRYYEQIGLMPRPHRTRGNYRSYGKDSNDRLRFIRRCRAFGFTLNQVRQLLHLASDKTKTCEEVRQIAAEHRRYVDAKIKELRLLSRELQRIHDRCQGVVKIVDCPILEALSTVGDIPGFADLAIAGEVRPA